MNQAVPTYVDGNAAAGDLSEIFALEMTAAMGQCNSCGVVMHFAETHVYEDAPGMVARCPSCDAMLMRMVKSDRHRWIDLRGLTYLQLSMPS